METGPKAIVLTLSLAMFGCVSFDRFVVVENQPLTAPQDAVVISIDKLALRDGRFIHFSELLHPLKEGDNIQVEIAPTGVVSNKVSIYFKRPVASTLNWKRGPELELPLSTHKIPAFERAMLGQGTLADRMENDACKRECRAKQ